MSDRYNAFIVILEQDIRDDDAQATIAAIRQIKGVLEVVAHVADPGEAIAEIRVRGELMHQLFDVLDSKRPGAAGQGGAR